MTGVGAWLDALDSAPLECDGMTRVISTLLQRDGLPHRVVVGRLEVAGYGVIPLHWWIELPDGRICDLRARMWLGGGETIPHGLALPTDRQRYCITEELVRSSVQLPGVVFELLVGKPLQAFAKVGELSSPSAVN